MTELGGLLGMFEAKESPSVDGSDEKRAVTVPMDLDGGNPVEVHEGGELNTFEEFDRSRGCICYDNPSSRTISPDRDYPAHEQGIALTPYRFPPTPL